MPFDYLNVSILENDIAVDDKKLNIDVVSEHLKKLPNYTDLVVLPELFSTGFVASKEASSILSEKNTEYTIDILKEKSKNLNCAICGSFLAHTAGRMYNRAFFLEPSGDETFYDKVHLFTMGGEKDIISGGKCPAPILRYRGWNIKPIICYDLRFPIFCRNIQNQYDVLIVVANWPKVRQAAWEKLLMARAIENSCYVIGVNRRGIGCDNIDYGSGSSIIVDYTGEIISSTTESSMLASATLSRTKLANFREKFPVWKDADNFELK